MGSGHGEWDDQSEERSWTIIIGPWLCRDDYLYSWAFMDSKVSKSNLRTYSLLKARNIESGAKYWLMKSWSSCCVHILELMGICAFGHACPSVDENLSLLSCTHLIAFRFKLYIDWVQHRIESKSSACLSKLWAEVSVSISITQSKVDWYKLVRLYDDNSQLSCKSIRQQ